ncbi:flagellar motor switch protein FliN [Pseudoteredinibacter isoporae]|uniref:Flagellar motor switch protein FliN n=1 Tax=Pseudoteredinibacter isoporae TaxID=570281 RepID=A0A7X0JXS0_9GAMM|nr:flagellar motor switch protein FliN [Pseudoteredinibacter isoporae]MBB6523465.1 flagellar motor switch protein FliN/FliY [Pseudoteredinibacter isoporae]NHO88974.1 flagellar motor switch protein FliN [Pseudoteredinibacter isoporae]NIB24318.1 flagellar motor switch protein FliN [Pseudoteredinibacter isoporae]
MSDDDQNDSGDVNQDDMADEWAAAMEEAGEGGDGDGGVEDDWAAAMAEAGVSEEEEEPEPEPAGDPMPLQDFSAPEGPGDQPDLQVVLDIPVTMSMEVGQTSISIRNLLQLTQGSVIELDRLAGEPLDVLVNGTLIAHGEVVVVNEKFGIRMTDVISPQERIARLR